jgi:hypothetical protein
MKKKNSWFDPLAIMVLSDLISKYVSLQIDIYCVYHENKVKDTEFGSYKYVLNGCFKGTVVNKIRKTITLIYFFNQHFMGTKRKLPISPLPSASPSPSPSVVASSATSVNEEYEQISTQKYLIDIPNFSKCIKRYIFDDINFGGADILSKSISKSNVAAQLVYISLMKSVTSFEFDLKIENSQMISIKSSINNENTL